jgi:hypothetical protein
MYLNKLAKDLLSICIILNLILARKVCVRVCVCSKLIGKFGKKLKITKTNRFFKFKKVIFFARHGVEFPDFYMTKNVSKF